MSYNSFITASLFSDIVFDKHKEVELIQGDILISKGSHEYERIKRGAVRPTNMLWPDGVIYYKFSPNLGELILLFAVLILFSNSFECHQKLLFCMAFMARCLVLIGGHIADA